MHSAIEESEAKLESEARLQVTKISDIKEGQEDKKLLYYYSFTEMIFYREFS